MSNSSSWKQDIRYLGGSAEAEAAIIRQFEKEIREVVLESAKERKGPPIRPQHAKQLAGIKRAEFRVDPNISTDLQFGFLLPGKVYPAWVRFSNAAGEIHTSDADSDLRGAAVRVIADSGPAHDWLMTNAEQHHAADAAQAMATTVAFTGGSLITQVLEGLLSADADLPALALKVTDVANKLSGIRRLIFHVGLSEGIHILKTLSSQMKLPVPSLTTETFWSRAPIAIGEVAAKYLLRPQLPKGEGTTPESLHDELTQRLRQGYTTFDFCLQRYQDCESTPIENARPAWTSPHEKIGELVLLQQDLGDLIGQEDSQFVNALAYNPWQVNTPDFVPIGNMNRARKSVYQASSGER